MTRGEAQSEESRLEAHGHIEREAPLSRMVRRMLAPLGLGQPDDIVSYTAPKKTRDPLEDTPEEAVKEFNAERLGGTSRNDQ